MITGGEKWHYLAVKCLFRILQGITSRYNGDYYCTIVFIHIEQKINSNHTKMFGRIKIIVT